MTRVRFHIVGNAVGAGVLDVKPSPNALVLLSIKGSSNSIDRVATLASERYIARHRAPDNAEVKKDPAHHHDTCVRQSNMFDFERERIDTRAVNKKKE